MWNHIRDFFRNAGVWGVIGIVFIIMLVIWVFNAVVSRYTALVGVNYTTIADLFFWAIVLSVIAIMCYLIARWKNIEFLKSAGAFLLILVVFGLLLSYTSIAIWMKLARTLQFSTTLSLLMMVLTTAAVWAAVGAFGTHFKLQVNKAVWWGFMVISIGYAFWRVVQVTQYAEFRDPSTGQPQIAICPEGNHPTPLRSLKGGCQIHQWVVPSKIIPFNDSNASHLNLMKEWERQGWTGGASQGPFDWMKKYWTITPKGSGSKKSSSSSIVVPPPTGDWGKSGNLNLNGLKWVAIFAVIGLCGGLLSGHGVGERIRGALMAAIFLAIIAIPVSCVWGRATYGHLGHEWYCNGPHR